MPRTAGPPKRQVLIRLPVDLADRLENEASERGYASLPAYLTQRIIQQAQNKARTVVPIQTGQLRDSIVTPRPKKRNLNND